MQPLLCYTCNCRSTCRYLCKKKHQFLNTFSARHAGKKKGFITVSVFFRVSGFSREKIPAVNKLLYKRPVSGRIRCMAAFKLHGV
jgi:hypothetical protein